MRVTLQTLAKIKQRWGISIKALVTRFQTLGVIDADHARSLFKQISARGWNRSEPVPVGTEQAVWFSRAIEAAARGYSDHVGTVAERIGLDRSHFERWLDWSAAADAEVADVVRPNFSGRSSKGKPDDRQAADVTLLRRRVPSCVVLVLLVSCPARPGAAGRPGEAARRRAGPVPRGGTRSGPPLKA